MVSTGPALYSSNNRFNVSLQESPESDWEEAYDKMTKMTVRWNYYFTKNKDEGTQTSQSEFLQVGDPHLTPFIFEKSILGKLE